MIRDAVFSECGLYRHRLDFDIADSGKVIALFGVNPSKAGTLLPDGTRQSDQTIMKGHGFGLRNGWRSGIMVNPFGAISTDVRRLALMDDPIGAGNQKHINAAIAEADECVPCWGNRGKVPKTLRFCFDHLLDQIVQSGKPIRIFGLTKTGDPMHPLMLGYSTQLQEWNP